MSRGYFGIGIYHTKTEVNIGTLWRSAHNFGASFIFTIGRRYKKQSSDTTKAWKTIPLYEFTDFVDCIEHTPKDCITVAIEQTKESHDVRKYVHPERAIYLLGAEDHGLPKEVIDRCVHVIHIDTPMCLNVATAGSIVMYDRSVKK